MAAEKTSAIVVRMADFSESSRVVTLFTRDFGKVAVIAKGAKRLKSPFEAALDLLTVCEVVFLRKSSSGLDILTEAQLRTRFRPGPGKLGSLYCGYYVAELLDSLSEDYDAHPILFDEACDALARFSSDDRIDLSLLRFELVLLREIGQLPAFDACVACSRPVSTNGRYAFKVTQGGLICEACLIEESPRYWTTYHAATLLQTLASDSNDWMNLAIEPREIPGLRRVLNSTIAHVLGRRPKMFRYLPFHEYGSP